MEIHIAVSVEHAGTSNIQTTMDLRAAASRSIKLVRGREADSAALLKPQCLRQSSWTGVSCCGALPSFHGARNWMKKGEKSRHTSLKRSCSRRLAPHRPTPRPSPPSASVLGGICLFSRGAKMFTTRKQRGLEDNSVHVCMCVFVFRSLCLYPPPPSRLWSLHFSSLAAHISSRLHSKAFHEPSFSFAC